MNCPQCGASLPDDAEFCGVCGYKFDKAASSNTQSQSAPNQPQIVYADGIVSGSLKDGWEVFKNRPGILMGMFVVMLIISSVAHSVINSYAGSDIAMQQIMANIWSMLQNIVFAGVLFSALKLVRNEEVDFGEMFSGFSKFLPLIVGSIVSTILVVLGLFLLVIPGIILTMGLSQWMFLIMDREAGAIESLKVSWNMMSGHKWSLFLLSLSLLGINLLGALALGIGLLVSLPTSIAVMAAFHKRLSQLNPPVMDQK